MTSGLILASTTEVKDQHEGPASYKGFPVQLYV